MDFFVQELFTSRGNYGDGSNRIGQKGRIWYDSASNTFRISDGVTPGGIVISGGSSQEVVGEFSGSFEFNIAADDSTQRTVNNGETVQFRGTNGITTASNDDGVITITGPDLSSYLTNNLAASFLPSEDIAYDLGSPSKRWRQLYLSDSTINLGSAVIEALGNTIQLPANSTIGEALISTFTGSYSDLTDRPSLFSGSYNNLTDRPTIPTDINQLTDNSGLLGGGGGGSYTLPAATESTLGGIKIGSGLAIDGSGVVSVTVSVVTSYNELTDRPTIPSDVSDLTDTGNLLFDGSYNSLTDTPTIPADVSDLTDTTSLLFSKSYNDLTNLPSLFSGSYTDLTNKPTIPTNNTELTNGAGYITAASLVGYATETYVTTRGYLTSVDYSIITNIPTFATVATSGSYNDLSNKPYIPDVGILTFEASTVDTADSSGINFTPLVTFNSDVIVENDIVVSNVIRTATGEIFATQAFVRQEVSSLVGSAPSALDTLQELAAALGNDENFATTVLNAITNADNAVRFDIASQNLTEQQKQNARNNIDAVSAADVYAAAIVMG